MRGLLPPTPSGTPPGLSASRPALGLSDRLARPGVGQRQGRVHPRLSNVLNPAGKPGLPRRYGGFPRHC
eukprot:232901-Prorocentrum_minimum.AAC.1